VLIIHSIKLALSALQPVRQIRKLLSDLHMTGLCVVDAERQKPAGWHSARISSIAKEADSIED
jgi:hypothetical protein